MTDVQQGEQAEQDEQALKFTTSVQISLDELFKVGSELASKGHDIQAVSSAMATAAANGLASLAVQRGMPLNTAQKVLTSMFADMNQQLINAYVFYSTKGIKQ